MKITHEYLNLLIEFYNFVLEQGHTFWACSAEDTERNRPYYYVQIHRTVGMKTCSNCQTLIELKTRIRRVQKALGLPQWPLYYKVNGDAVKLVASDSSPFNPNYQYLKHK